MAPCHACVNAPADYSATTVQFSKKLSLGVNIKIEGDASNFDIQLLLQEGQLQERSLSPTESGCEHAVCPLASRR